MSQGAPETITRLPALPGVYRFRATGGTVEAIGLVAIALRRTIKVVRHAVVAAHSAVAAVGCAIEVIGSARVAARRHLLHSRARCPRHDCAPAVRF